MINFVSKCLYICHGEDLWTEKFNMAAIDLFNYVSDIGIILYIFWVKDFNFNTINATDTMYIK